jgi:hypothetical protein
MDATQDLKFVQDLGRHENVATTMKYVSSNRKEHHKKVSAIAVLLSEDGNKGEPVRLLRVKDDKSVDR